VSGQDQRLQDILAAVQGRGEAVLNPEEPQAVLDVQALWDRGFLEPVNSLADGRLVRVSQRGRRWLAERQRAKPQGVPSDREDGGA
jgi:hypothetical protein